MTKVSGVEISTGSEAPAATTPTPLSRPPEVVYRLLRSGNCGTSTMGRGGGGGRRCIRMGISPMWRFQRLNRRPWRRHASEPTSSEPAIVSRPNNWMMAFDGEGGGGRHDATPNFFHEPPPSSLQTNESTSVDMFFHHQGIVFFWSQP